MTAALHLSRPRAERLGAQHRVVAEVDGESLWFSSPDAPLAPSPEAFASAILPAVLESRRTLESEAALSPRWLEGARGIAAVGAEWWGWGELEVRSPSPRPSRGSASRAVSELLSAIRRRQRSTHRLGATALAFSGGADSFHALLSGDVDVLLSVHGFDIPLADSTRMDEWEKSFRVIAATSGARAVLVRTNLRDHPISALSSWPHAHGGALAAVGHLLTGAVDRLVVASSYPRWIDAAWGSHWRLDPLWSSERLEVLHVGDDLWRTDKLREIGTDPLVQRHLRVCWENRSAALNCGRCEKCVRTQLALETVGALAGSSVFPGGESLTCRVDGVEHVDNPELTVVYERLGEALPGEVGDAVLRLLARSAALVPPP